MGIYFSKIGNNIWAHSVLVSMGPQLYQRPKTSNSPSQGVMYKSTTQFWNLIKL